MAIQTLNNQFSLPPGGLASIVGSGQEVPGFGVAAAPNYADMVASAYGGIGRSGIGAAPNQIDQEGYNFWMDQLASGALNQQNFMPTFQAAVAGAKAAQPAVQPAVETLSEIETQPATTNLASIVGTGREVPAIETSAAAQQPVTAPAVQQPVDQIEQLYNQYASRWSDPEGYEYWKNRFGTDVDEGERQIFQQAVQNVYNQGLESKDIYANLGKDSSAQEIAAAYDNFVGRAGGDTQQSQQAASQYLSSLGVDADTIAKAAEAYKGDYASGIADKVFESFGAAPGAVPSLTGILSGFRAIGGGDVDVDAAKRILGEDTYNQYRQTFGNELKSSFDKIFEDKNLTGQEALSAIKTARDYGLDANQFQELTGYKPEVFNALQEGYDNTVKSMVSKAIGDTDNLGDKIKTAIALQSQYGITDDDFAKAAGIDAAQFKSQLAGVRNFENDLKKATSAPDATSKDILSFIQSSKDNAGVNAVYGTNLNALEQKVNELNNKWSQYGVDGYQAENVYNQLGKITEAAGSKNWNGSWAGGGESSKEFAVKKLVELGVDNLADLKIGHEYEKAYTSYEAYKGQPVIELEDGRKVIDYIDPNTGERTSEFVPEGAKLQPAMYDVRGEDYAKFRPLTEEELKTYDPKTGSFQRAINNTLVDSSTGKVISKTDLDSNNFVIDNYSTGNFLKAKDKTFGIMMTDKGIPVPYNTTEKGGFVYSPTFGIMMSALMPGIGSTISQGVASAGGSALGAGTLANAALTQGIMSGGMAALTGGDVGKAFLSGAVAAPVSAGISNILPAGLDPNLAKFATNVGTNLVRGAITGQPTNLAGSVLNAGLQYGAGQLPLNLTPQQVNFLSGIATPLLMGQSINPIQLGGILANYSMANQRAQGGR